MGRLELPLPEIGKPLEAHAKDMQARLREHVPTGLRESVKVTAFKKGDKTGIAIEYDDRAENFVYSAMEYPRGRGEEKPVGRR
jgi:hypothetical protein